MSILFAVLAAFALDNWNENRKEGITENKILAEIENGLEKDLDDIRINMGGHEAGILACKFWRNLITDKEVNLDSLPQQYLNLTRDFISIQNTSGYETLKSRGLELVKNDSLRFDIISLYEYDYNTLRKFEEEYQEMQFQDSYFDYFNRVLAPLFRFDDKGNMINIDLPINLPEAERKILLTYLWKIQVNRSFILRYYGDIENKVSQVQKKIEKELKV